MYDFLKGTVVNLDSSGHLSLEVGGVGYLLRVSEHTRATIPLDGSTVTMHVRLQVKEDDLTLFGFAEVAERAAFDLLCSVQGVGPAVALAILSHLTVAQLKEALFKEDAATLRGVKGVGAKSASRLVLELHDKLDRIPTPLEPVAGVSADAVEEARQALVALGFSAAKITEALKQVDAAEAGPEEILRQALALLR